MKKTIIIIVNEYRINKTRAIFFLVALVIVDLFLLFLRNGGAA